MPFLVFMASNVGREKKKTHSEIIPKDFKYQL